MTKLFNKTALHYEHYCISHLYYYPDHRQSIVWTKSGILRWLRHLPCRASERCKLRQRAVEFACVLSFPV
jgi:hypothetical protein